MQSRDATDFQNSTGKSKADVSPSDVQPFTLLESNRLPAAENPEPSSESAATSSVSQNILQQKFRRLNDKVTHLLEFLNRSPIRVDDGAWSDIVQDLQSDVLNYLGISAGCENERSGRDTDEMLSDPKKMMREMRKSMELLESSLNEQMSGSDSGHDDAYNLPPRLSGDIVNGDTDAHVQQEHLSDAQGSSDEAAAAGQKATSLVQQADCTSKPPLAAVQPFRAEIASKVPEFAAQGNLKP